MTNTLNRICEYKLQEIKEARELMPLSKLEEKIASQPSSRDFIGALRAKQQERKYPLIAEVKQASPTKGLIRGCFDLLAIVSAYDKGGAACLSILTDGLSFRGSLHYMVQARQICSLPILRKDFILDPYQVYEARAYGADCILLILNIINDQVAQEIEKCALALGMQVLIEVYDEIEIERALKMNSKLVGINNRQLSTFKVDLSKSKELVSMFPADYFVVSESGIWNNKDCESLSEAGISAFLVSESLMRQPDIESATRELITRYK